MSERTDAPPDRSAASDAEDTSERGDGIGIFPSWRILYVAVTVYTFAVVLLLYALTRILDHSAG